MGQPVLQNRLRCRLSFSLLRSSIQAIRGPSRGKAVIAAELATVESMLQQWTRTLSTSVPFVFVFAFAFAFCSAFIFVYFTPRDGEHKTQQTKKQKNKKKVPCTEVGGACQTSPQIRPSLGSRLRVRAALKPILSRWKILQLQLRARGLRPQSMSVVIIIIDIRGRGMGNGARAHNHFCVMPRVSALDTPPTQREMLLPTFTAPHQRRLDTITCTLFLLSWHSLLTGFSM